MGDDQRFSEKWEFRRQENNFDDSSSDDPDSNSTQDPIIHNPNLVLDSNQLDDGTKTVTREQPAKTTRKRRSKKDESSKTEKAKQVRRRKPKAVCAEDSTKKKDETTLETDDDDVGMFMKTLLDDLTASRESLMDWMKTELCGTDHNAASRPPPRKRAVAAVATQRPVKKRTTKTKKKGEEEEKETEKQSKPDEICQEMMRKDKEIAQNNGGDKVQELDYNAGPLDVFLKSSDHGGLGRNYFQQQEQSHQEGIVAQTEKNVTVTTNQKSVVLAIKAPTLSQKQKKMREVKNRASMVERRGSETQKDDNFAIPFAPPSLSSSSPLLQSFPVGPSLSSLFPPSSSQVITSYASDNNNFQLRQPPVSSQIPDLYELQTGFTGGKGFGNPLFHNNNNGYFSGFPAAFQPNLISGGYNFPAQVNPATTSQQSGNNNMFGGLRMAGGAMRLSESQVGNCNNSLSDYRNSSGR
ncbi:unnamed protein product [Microthlaspi erraticum]|uniref:Uncharacterized protein n=1 Tax=Microthlaspi erraticum TaxID=1685480 RepID=A0A6D2JH64_9BRAS|nr:unnamed protein product [Microthlaspi erraticum]